MTRDIFILLGHPKLHTRCCDIITTYIRENYGSTADDGTFKLTVDAIVAPDTKGFLFAPSIAKELGLKFIPIRKENKLTGDLIKETYKCRRRRKVSLWHAIYYSVVAMAVCVENKGIFGFRECIRDARM